MRFDSVTPTRAALSTARARWDLFLVSLVILFLELACIRWFPAHVLFLTFFTNTVLLACFLGMSVGCLAANHRRDYLNHTPLLLAVALGAAYATEIAHARMGSPLVGGVEASTSPQQVFFGADYTSRDVSRFYVPVEAVGGFFFLLLALVMLGLGQEMGRAFTRVPSRVGAYTMNIMGSVVGIVLFSLASWYHVSPIWWFLAVALGIAYFLAKAPQHQADRSPRERLTSGAIFLAITVGLASLTSGILPRSSTDPFEHYWSPYYRVDYEDNPTHSILVNLIGHQNMVSWQAPGVPAYAYALPHLLRRDSGGPAVEDMLIIGAGSGNDVSRALQWPSVKHIDAVEIDPAIQRLGMQHHPDQPYQDPRVTPHLNDGRNFLRATDKKYDMIVYALVDSLVLHSSYSNLRLESYLFTRQAFEDARRCLKPDGVFVIYNYFRQGWLVGRIEQGLEAAFGGPPLVIAFPYRAAIEPDSFDEGFTMFIAGKTGGLKKTFEVNPEYWLRSDQPLGPQSPNGFQLQPSAAEKERFQRFGLAEVERPKGLMPATDNWPFVYLRQPMLPDLSLRGLAIMGGISLVLLATFLPRRQGTTTLFNGRMFFLGAAFMLVETRAVIHMALIFGSTWIVNSVVFFAVLVMILAANLYVLTVRPQRPGPYYFGLWGALAVNLLVPLDTVLGAPFLVQILCASVLVFTPILFAGIIFATELSKSIDPDRDMGANIAGAILGGFAENLSMLIGFQNLVLVAAAFYVLSAVVRAGATNTVPTVKVQE